MKKYRRVFGEAVTGWDEKKWELTKTVARQVQDQTNKASEVVFRNSDGSLMMELNKNFTVPHKLGYVGITGYTSGTIWFQADKVEVQEGKVLFADGSTIEIR